MQKKNKATMALLASALGVAGTSGWAASGGFIPGMLHHGFLAATIGGLADWFAVTALFRKPLGISYRTEILRRNRGRIMDAIVAFTSDDLLSVENIMSVVREQDTAALLVDYLECRGGREHVREVVDEVLLRAVSSMDSRAVAESLGPAIREGLSGFALEQALKEALRLLAEERHSRQALSTLLAIGEQVLAAPAVQEALLENIRVLRRAYEGDSAGRAMVLAALDLSDERILEIFNKRAAAHLEKLLAEDTEAWAELRDGFAALLRKLADDESVGRLLRSWREHYLEHLDISGCIEEWLERNVKGEDPFWLPQIHRFLDGRIDLFVQSGELQRKCDRFVKGFLEEELQKHHAMIPSLIRERLEEFDDDELTAFVESKVADDLQMIRINGSVVGALVGMGLYLAVWLAERMWGA